MKEDLFFASLGNGVTVWDRNRQEFGDAKIVAHITGNVRLVYRINTSPKKQ